MRVLLVYTDADFYAGCGYDAAWRAALEAQGARVEQLAALPEAWARDGVPAGRYALAIPHVLVEEVAAFAPTLRLTAALEAAGVPLLNPVGAVLASTDKLATHAVWATAGLPQPATWDLEATSAWPAPGRELLLKPSWCDAGRHIVRVADLATAREHVAAWRADEAAGGERRGTALLQEHVRGPRVLRLFATPDEASDVYEKDLAPGEVVSHGTVYRSRGPAPPELEQLARDMVASLGAGLLGVDVLVGEDGRAVALEANAPFGFDVTDPEQGAWIAAAALRRAAVPT